MQFSVKMQFWFILFFMMIAMPVLATLPLSEPDWHSLQDNAEIQHVAKSLQDWLLTRESLTARIKQACPKSFKLKVIQQKWQYPLPTEARLLGISTRSLVWVREVELGCHGQPWEFGRTVIPASTLTEQEKKLLTLGTTPLGEILFKDPTMRRSEFELAKLTDQHYLYQQATHSVSNPSATLWARRSVFYLHNKPLLVTEVYTPWLPALR